MNSKSWLAEEARKNQRLRIIEVIVLAFLVCLFGGFVYTMHYLATKSLTTIIETL